MRTRERVSKTRDQCSVDGLVMNTTTEEVKDALSKIKNLEASGCSRASVCFFRTEGREHPCFVIF